MRSFLDFAGLPRPRSNIELGLEEEVRVVGDLVYPQWLTVVEYEGTQHQEERGQYTNDIDRYAVMRDHHRSYVQVTKEHMHSPRKIVLRVHKTLRLNGYDGPAPLFGFRWEQLFRSLREAVGPRDYPDRKNAA